MTSSKNIKQRPLSIFKTKQSSQDQKNIFLSSTKNFFFWFSLRERKLAKKWRQTVLTHITLHNWQNEILVPFWPMCNSATLRKANGKETCKEQFSAALRSSFVCVLWRRPLTRFFLVLFGAILHFLALFALFSSF